MMGSIPKGVGASVPDRAFVPSASSPQAVSPVPASIPSADDYDYDDDPNDCYECGGEGFVSDCVEEFACLDPEYGCDYCTRRCPLCNPAKRDPALDAALSDALAAQGMSAGTAETAQQAQGEARQPGPKDAPTPNSPEPPHGE